MTVERPRPPGQAGGGALPDSPPYFTLAQFQAAAEAIRRRIRRTPAVAIVLGSGLGALADQVEQADVVGYADVPHWPVSTVEGHHGRLLVGQLQGQPVAVMQGRAHFYEGYSPAHLGLPVRVLRLLGVHTLIVSNAAGGLNPDFRPGDLMLLTDHLNLLGMAGFSPLRGPNEEAFGPRFPDMSQTYDPALRRLALDVAAAEGIPLRQGVYVCLAGPSYETPADLRFLRLIGADAVGMSTVPEVTAARHAGLRVLGFSGITNVPAMEVGAGETSHAEVLEAGRMLGPRLIAVIRGVLRGLPPSPS
jgi:purine-nucleoside phosphorylase